MSLLELCQWLETTRVGELVTLSQYGFPILVTIHVLGLGLSAGTIFWMDLRLLGRVLTSFPAQELYRRLWPWIVTGFILMFVSGGMLLVGYAASAYANLYFRLKLVALMAAGINATVYHAMTSGRVVVADTGTHLPTAARAAGLISITAWTVVILAGRMMSYTMF